MLMRTCVVCGKEFESKSSRRKMCYDTHYHSCPICGCDVVTIDLQHLHSCCSVTCSRQKASQSTVARYEVHPSSTPEAKERRRNTNLTRYGSENVMGSLDMRNRAREHFIKAWDANKECIQSKKKDTCLQKYGTEHPMQNQEVRRKQEQTTYAHYGFHNPAQAPEIQAKMKSTMLQKYGVENAFQSDIIKEQIKSTNLSKYGTEYAVASSVVADKVAATMLDRYGTIYPRKNVDINSKAISTYANHSEDLEFVKTRNRRYQASMDSLYGGVGFASSTLSEKAVVTMKERYGVNYFPESDEWKEKYQATSLARYQESNPMKCDAIKQKVSDSLSKNKNVPWPAYLTMKDTDRLDELLKFKENPRSYIMNIKEDLRTEPAIAEMLGVTPSAVSAYVISHDLYDIVHVSKSGMEDQVCEFLDTLHVTYVRNTRQIIAPLELDIYLPEFRIGIECNPTVTHNSSFYDPWGGAPKHYKYHQDKSYQCKQNDVFLFHIFGYEWTNRTDVVKSMIQNLVNANEHKIYARKTHVKFISPSECMQFLDNNHRQGATNASIRLGLVAHETDELVAVMTFNKVRKSLGMNNTTGNILELSRFCNMVNTSVVGGASKLFSYFIKNYAVDRVVSFSDVAHTTGNLYTTLGFNAVQSSSPGYVWVNTKDDSYYTRVSCQKNNLRNLFKDDSIDIENKTEKEIMMEHGYAQVFDSGVIRWEYNLIY